MTEVTPRSSNNTYALYPRCNCTFIRTKLFFPFLYSQSLLQPKVFFKVLLHLYSSTKMYKSMYVCAVQRLYGVDINSSLDLFVLRRRKKTNCRDIHSQEHHRLAASCQFYRLVATCQQACQFHQIATAFVAICHLQTCYNLQQPVDNKFG